MAGTGSLPIDGVHGSEDGIGDHASDYNATDDILQLAGLEVHALVVSVCG